MSNYILKSIKEGKPTERRIINTHPEDPQGILLYLDVTNIESLYNKVLANKKFSILNNEIYEKINQKDHESNLEHMALELSLMIKPSYSIKDIFAKYKNINNTNTELYPSMPLKFYGYVQHFKNKNTIKLSYENSEIDIILKSSTELFKEKKFIYNRLIYIIGSIESLENQLSIYPSAIFA